MSVLTLNVDEVMRTLSAESSNPFVVHDKEVDIVRFAINSGFADIVLDGQVALRVMYQRPGETEVRAKTLTYYDTDGLHNYYDWQLSQSDLAKNGSLMVALCILDISGGEVSEWHTTPCAVRVLSTIHTDDSDEEDDTITPTVKERVAVLETMIQRVASGAPIVVSSTSEMTDTEQIYVLSTNGRWYYHNGTTWVSGGTYGAVSTDTTLTQSGAPADAKVVGDELTAVKADLPQISGWSGIGSSFSVGNYTPSGPNTDPTRAYMVIQNVGKGSKIIFDPTKVHVNYYYITSATNYAYLYTPGFWDISGEVTLTYADNSVVFIVAKDATDSSARISDNIPLVNSAIKIYNVKKDSLSKESLHQTLCNAQGKTVILGSFIKGAYANNGPIADPTRIYMIVDNLNSGSYVEFDASRIALNYYYIKSKTNFTNLYSPNRWDTSGRIVFSQSDKGNTIFIVAKDVNNGSSRIGDHPELLNNAITIFAKEIVPRKINWVAYGDSITNGSYSTSDGRTKNDMYHGYAYRIAKVLHSDMVDNFYNCGVRGIGWINAGNNGETFDDMLALFTGDKSTIQLVTIMLGINDYLSNETIGDENATEKDGTISGNIRYGIRWIGENFPNAKIVVISPMNSTMHGNAGTAWSRKAWLLNAHTLDDVASIIKYWCNFFGVRYVDELTEGYINTYNISNYLLDYIHPSDDGQWMLAQDVASKIL